MGIPNEPLLASRSFARCHLNSHSMVGTVGNLIVTDKTARNFGHCVDVVDDGQCATIVSLWVHYLGTEEMVPKALLL